MRCSRDCTRCVVLCFRRVFVLGDHQICGFPFGFPVPKEQSNLRLKRPALDNFSSPNCGRPPTRVPSIQSILRSAKENTRLTMEPIQKHPGNSWEMDPPIRVPRSFSEQTSDSARSAPRVTSGSIA